MRGCRRRTSRATPRRCTRCGTRSSAPELLDLGRIGVELAAPQLLERRRGQLLVAAPVALELLVVDLLEVEQRVVRALGGADQLVQLELDRGGVAVLRVL